MKISRSASLFWAGVLVINVGTAPLLLYVMLGPASGFSIGVGLLVALWLSWVIGIVLLLGAVVAFLRSHSTWEEELER